MWTFDGSWVMHNAILITITSQATQRTWIFGIEMKRKGETISKKEQEKEKRDRRHTVRENRNIHNFGPSENGCRADCWDLAIDLTYKEILRVFIQTNMIMDFWPARDSPESLFSFAKYPSYPRLNADKRMSSDIAKCIQPIAIFTATRR